MSNTNDKRVSLSKANTGQQKPSSPTRLPCPIHSNQQNTIQQKPCHHSKILSPILTNPQTASQKRTSSNSNAKQKRASIPIRVPSHVNQQIGKQQKSSSPTKNPPPILTNPQNAKQQKPTSPTKVPCPIHTNPPCSKSKAINIKSNLALTNNDTHQSCSKPALITPENAMLEHLKTQDHLIKLESEIETSRKKEKLKKIHMYEQLKELSARQLELHNQITIRASNKNDPDNSKNNTEIRTDEELRAIMRAISASLQKIKKSMQSPCVFGKEPTKYSPHFKLENQIRDLQVQYDVNKRSEIATFCFPRQSSGIHTKSFVVQTSLDQTKPQSLDSLTKKRSESKKIVGSCGMVVENRNCTQIPNRNYSFKDIQKTIIKLAISLNNVNIFDKHNTELKKCTDSEHKVLLENLQQVISSESFEQYELISEYLFAIRQKKIDQQFRLEMERALEDKWYTKEQNNKQTGVRDNARKSVWLEQERIKYLQSATKPNVQPTASKTKSLQDFSWEWMHRDNNNQSNISIRPDEEIALDILRLLDQEERILLDEIDKGKWKLTEKETKMPLDVRVQNRKDKLDKKWNEENVEMVLERENAKKVRLELEHENSKLNRIKSALGKQSGDADLVFYYEKKLKSLNSDVAIDKSFGDKMSQPTIQPIIVNQTCSTKSMQCELQEQLTQEHNKKDARSAEILNLIKHLEDELNKLKTEDLEWKQLIRQEFIKAHDLRKSIERQRLVETAELENVCEICELERNKHNRSKQNQLIQVSSEDNQSFHSLECPNSSISKFKSKGCNKPLCNCAVCPRTGIAKEKCPIHQGKPSITIFEGPQDKLVQVTSSLQGRLVGKNSRMTNIPLNLEDQRNELIEDILANMVSKNVIKSKSVTDQSVCGVCQGTQSKNPTSSQSSNMIRKSNTAVLKKAQEEDVKKVEKNESIPSGYSSSPSDPHVREWFHRHVPTGQSSDSIKNKIK